MSIKIDNITSDFIDVDTRLVSSVRAKSNPRKYVICKSTPTFSGPRYQSVYIITHKPPQQVFDFQIDMRLQSGIFHDNM